MATTPLTLPITLPQPGTSSISLEQQCSEATVLSVTAWHANGASGAALGSDDGSIYLFHPAEPSSSLISSSNSPAPASPALLPMPSTDNSPRSSRMLAPFSLTARAPAAVSVTKDQVEAPKNFVDFDAEQEKLAALIQKPTSGSVASRRKHIDTEEGPSSTSSSSRAQSPAPTKAAPVQIRTVHLSSSPFPPLAPSARIFSPRTGIGHAVTALQVLEDASALIALQECGDLSVYDVRDGLCNASVSLVSGPSISPPSGERPVIEAAWAWNRLFVLSLLDSTVILACASESWSLSSADPTSDNATTKRCRLAIARMTAHQDLTKVAEWTLDAVPESVSLSSDLSGLMSLSFIDSEAKLFTQTVSIVSQPLAVVADAVAPATTTVGPITLNIPNPFKHLAPRNDTTEVAHAEKQSRPGLVEIGERQLSGAVRIEGEVLGSTSGAIWSIGGVYLYMSTSEVVRSGWIDTDGHSAVDVRWISDTKVVVTSELQVTTYRVSSRSSSTIEFQQLSAVTLPGAHLCLSTISSPSMLISVRTGSAGARRVVVVPLVPSSSKPSKAKPVWRAPSAERKAAQNPTRVSALLPVEVHSIIVGYSNGVITQGRFGALEPAPPREVDGAQIERLFLFHAQTDLVIAGDASGALLILDYPSLKFRRKWVKFLTPLAHVVPLRREHVGRLNGHAFCVAEDGTAAVLDPSVLELVCVIPGSPMPLERIAIAEDNLLLFYSDGRARLWDVKTMVFWRAMALDKAEELVSQGVWLDLRLDNTTSPKSVLRSACGDGDARSTLLLDVRALNEMTSPPPQSFSFIRRQGPPHDADTLPPDADGSQPAAVSPEHIKVVSSVLLALLSRGLSDDVDEFISTRLDYQAIEPSVGTYGARGSIVVYSPHSAIESWTISPQYTAARLLATVTLLRICLGFSDWEKDASAAIAFYVVTLPDYVGPAFQPPCLESLSRYWYDTSAELRQAARTIFESSANRMSDQETIAFVEKWQHELPTLQPDAEKQDSRAARALLLAGHLAVEKQSLISVSVLTDIAKSINLYLHDATSPHRILAVELCSKGFQIWQHYIDAMEMLRALFALATNMRKDASTIAPAARLAVLQIASTSTPLFMATLSLDILKPRNLAHRKSTMGLIAFFIRKKPLVLYPNLTRLVEAVVKSLDPNNSTDREAVQDSATEILGQVVKTFPSVDFHMASQRLAMGTTEGAVVLYDLKTATRLYVLDGYTSRVAALSFSPDGRRLAGVSLEECTVNIWKVGQGFSSLFKPGAPPAGSNPFKSYPFNVGDEARMTVASTLDWVSFEWPAERSARLKIRDSTLTFAT